MAVASGAESVAAVAVSALVAIAMEDHAGKPVWFVAIVVTATLIAALLASSERVGDQVERHKARRKVWASAGLLWCITLSATFHFGLSVALATMLAATLGIMGAALLDLAASPEHGKQIALAIVDRVMGMFGFQRKGDGE